MKTVHDLDEDEFLERFNRDMDLDEIFRDVRMERAGLEIVINDKRKYNRRYSIRVDNQDPLNHERLRVYTLALVIGLGYCANDEAMLAMDYSLENHWVNITNLRKLVGKGRIKARRGSAGLPGGTYLEDIAQHRQRHIISWQGYQLNTKTGYFVVPQTGSTILNSGDAQFIMHLIENQGRFPVEKLTKSLYSYHDFDTEKSLWVRRSHLDLRIRQGVGSEDRIVYIKNGECKLREFQ